jgi:hypothetical protein
VDIADHDVKSKVEDVDGTTMSAVGDRRWIITTLHCNALLPAKSVHSLGDGKKQQVNHCGVSSKLSWR